MSDSSTHTNWYRTGSATVQNNSRTINGQYTYWANASLHPGDLFSLDGSKFYEIDTVDSNTKLTLKTPYLGETASNVQYSIVRNFTASLPAEIAAMVAAIVEKHERYVNLDLQTVKGQSAYDLALENGFTGTMTDYLQSITAFGQAQAAGFKGSYDEWTAMIIASKSKWEALESRATSLENRTSPLETRASNLETRTENLNERVIPLETSNDLVKERLAPFLITSPDNNLIRAVQQGIIHSRSPRMKNLGNSFTDEQKNAIKTGTFDDLYLGDYWEFDCNTPGMEKFFFDADSRDDKNMPTSGYWKEFVDNISANPSYFYYKVNANTGAKSSDKHYWVIVDFNYTTNKNIPYGSGSSSSYMNGYQGCSYAHWRWTFTRPSITIMPAWFLYAFNIPAELDTNGGYNYSAFRTGDCPLLTPACDLISSFFGSEYIQYYTDSISASTDEDNNVTSWVTNIMGVELPTEEQIFGSKMYQSKNLSLANTASYKQFELCKYWSSNIGDVSPAMHTCYTVLRDVSCKGRNHWCCTEYNQAQHPSPTWSTRLLAPCVSIIGEPYTGD